MVGWLLLIDLFPHFFTGAKGNHLSWFDGNGLSGTGIAATAGLLVAYIKGSEMDKFNGFTIKEPVFHAIQKCVNKFRAGALGVTKLGGEGFG
jgi:hypothetical protein